MKRGLLWAPILLGILLISGVSAYGQAIPRDPTAGWSPGTPIVGVFSGADTSSATATLTGVANKVTYICGFSVSGLGATSATNVTVTVATVAGGTLSFSYAFASGATALSTTLLIFFPMCLPNNTIGGNIVVTVPGAAGNTATQINAHGYVQ